MVCKVKLRSASHNCIILRFSMKDPLPFSSNTCEALCRLCKQFAVMRDRCAMDKMVSGSKYASHQMHSRATLLCLICQPDGDDAFLSCLD
jgi:hypothetical protein